MLTLAAYSLDLPAYACARLRLIDPVRALAGRVALRWGAESDGVNYAIDASAMDGADLIVFQRYFPMRETWPLVERALASGRPVVYETDDDFLNVPEDHPMHDRLAPAIPFARELTRRADLVTVSTAELKRVFTPLARRVEVLPNLLDESLWTPTAVSGKEPDRSRPLRLVHAGTPSHAGDLEPIVPVLARLKKRLGDSLELVFLGVAPAGLEARTIPFDADYAAYARRLRDLAPDLAVAPLRDIPFNRGKSAVKWLEYSAAGAAGVYADLPPYAPVRHGETGLKADLDGFEEALFRLALDGEYRAAVAARAGREVLGRWGLRRGAGAYHRVWRGLADGGNGRDKSGREPALGEPCEKNAG